MFIYENGLPVGYDHRVNNFECRETCIRPELHARLEERMLQWYRSLPGQARVRLGKVGMMQGSEPNLNRLLNE